MFAQTNRLLGASSHKGDWDEQVQRAALAEAMLFPPAN